MKKKLFAIILCLAILLSTVASLSELSFAQGSGGIDLSIVNTIAKGEDGKYYALRTYGNTYDNVSARYFYEITEAQYNTVASDCFMVFKRMD